MRLPALIGVLLLLWVGAEITSEAGETDSDLASTIDSLLKKASSNGAGYAVIVEVDGEIILSKGYGYANRDRGTAFTPGTIAQIGSLTKQFTATAILQLAEAGDVDIAAPIKHYIPEIKAPVGDVTLHHLLTHSSGLPEYCGDDFDRLSRDEFLHDCLTLPLLFEPGSDFAYSNVGYGAIAAVLEFITKQDFEAYLEEAVLRPNGLKSTGHFFSGDSGEGLAHGYLESRDMGNIAEQIRALGNNWWNLKGNGGMQASVLDMHAWYKTLNGDGALGQKVRARLTTPHSPWVDGVAEGYGWYFRSDDDGRMRQMSHSGSDGVFFSYYWHRLDKRVFMYFVGNSGEEPTKVALRKVLGIVTSRFDCSGSVDKIVVTTIGCAD
jgi:CubicO group peptidase (beta-lactamase class C family)